MAFATKTKSGRFRGVAKQGRTVLGTKTFDRQRDAKDWAERVEAAAEGGLDVKASKARAGKLMDEWLAVRKDTVTPSS